MKKTARSLGYSVTGLVHAFQAESNLRRFLLGHVLLMLIAVLLRVDVFAVLLSTVVAGFFLTIELLNTAIERLADTIDDNEKKHRAGYYHQGLRLGKDVAAAASLMALAVYVVMIILIFLPYFLFSMEPI